MSESKTGEPSKENYSREQVIELLRSARERTGVRHPDDPGFDDPAIEAYLAWCSQANPYTGVLPPKAAEHSWNLDMTLAYFDAGFDDPDFLDELVREFLVQDRDAAKVDRTEEGMKAVLGRINNAIRSVRRVESKL